MKSPVLVVVSACLLASGCTTYEQMETARIEQERQDYNTCVGYGATPNTQAFADCRRDLALARDRDYSYSSNDGRYYDPYPYPQAFGPGYHRRGYYYR
jgi:hypothetical protein